MANHQDEVNHLRQHLSSHPGPSATDPITLPPALISILIPHINKSLASSPPDEVGDAQGSSGGSGAASTTTTALIQRVRLLQDENDELYDLLKHGETGRLKEEVRSLRRVVARLERALRGTDSSHPLLNRYLLFLPSSVLSPMSDVLYLESHQVITTLSYVSSSVGICSENR